MCVSLKDSQCSQKRPHAGNCSGPRVVLPLPPPPTCQSCSGLRAAREPQGHRAAPRTRPARPGAHGRHGDALVGTAGRLRGSGLSSQASAGAGPALGSTTPRPPPYPQSGRRGTGHRGHGHRKACPEGDLAGGGAGQPGVPEGLGRVCGRGSGSGRGGAGAHQTDESCPHMAFARGPAKTAWRRGTSPWWPSSVELRLLSPIPGARSSLLPLPGAF